MIDKYVLFSFGITLISILVVTHKNIYAGIIIFSLFFLILFRLVFQTQKIFLSLCIFFILGISIFQYIEYEVTMQNKLYESGFIYKNKTEVEIKGKIFEFPDYAFSNNQYIVHLQNSKTNILVFTQSFQKFSYADQIEFTGTLQDIRSQGNEWYQYYQKLNVQYTVLYPQNIQSTITVSKETNTKILYNIFIFKNYIRGKVIERFSSHTSALILGMLLGSRDELSKEEKEMFRHANLSHILVVSGYNISLVVAFIFLILKSFNRYLKVSITMICIFMFVLLVGNDPSVVRSALMGCIVICTHIINRQSVGIHVLLLAATLMLLINPISIFDIGFHLSFLATYSLCTLPKFNKVPEYVSSTIWVSVFISMYLLYFSGSISLIGVFVNIAVLFCIPIFMLTAFGSIVLLSLHIFIGVDVFILEILTRYIFYITNISQFFPSLLYKITPHFAVLFYCFLICSTIFLNNRYTTLEFIEKHYQKFVPQKPS